MILTGTGCASHLLDIVSKRLSSYIILKINVESGFWSPDEPFSTVTWIVILSTALDCMLSSLNLAGTGGAALLL